MRLPRLGFGLVLFLDNGAFGLFRARSARNRRRQSRIARARTSWKTSNRDRLQGRHPEGAPREGSAARPGRAAGAGLARVVLDSRQSSQVRRLARSCPPPGSGREGRTQPQAQCGRPAGNVATTRSRCSRTTAPLRRVARGWLDGAGGNPRQLLVPEPSRHQLQERCLDLAGADPTFLLSGRSCLGRSRHRGRPAAATRTLPAVTWSSKASTSSSSMLQRDDLRAPWCRGG